MNTERVQKFQMSAQLRISRIEGQLWSAFALLHVPEFPCVYCCYVWQQLRPLIVNGSDPPTMVADVLCTHATSFVCKEARAGK